jgi:hypothetical protein
MVDREHAALELLDGIRDRDRPANAARVVRRSLLFGQAYSSSSTCSATPQRSRYRILQTFALQSFAIVWATPQLVKAAVG